MSRKKNPSLLRQVRHLPGDIISKNPTRRKNAYLTVMIILLVIAMVLMGLYTAIWYIERSRIIGDSERYRAMYASRSESASPTRIPDSDLPVWATATPETATATPVAVTPSPIPATATPVAKITSPADIAATPVAGTPAVVTATPEAVSEAPAKTVAAETTPAASCTPAPEAAEDDTYPIPHDIPIAEGTVAPLATPNENTIIFALPTPPPVQSSFEDLLSMNSDTIGFLEIEDVIALPVVQKPNDNDYYLNHNFEKNKAIEGALFLDGSNLLIPEDDCLIVYGHNMKNDTMFGRLSSFTNMAFLKSHATITFDTLYENRTYVPFAAFTASMDKDSSYYFDVRQFVFDEYSFDQFVSDMKARSTLNIPVDVQWGDRLLLLVTCNYNNNSGRFILGLRQLRPGETEAQVWATVLQTQPK